MENLLHTRNHKERDSKEVIPEYEFGFCSLKEAAGFLKISKSKMQKMSASRVLPVYKPDGKVFFKIQDLKDYMESGRQQSIREIVQESITKNPKTVVSDFMRN